MAAFKKTCTAQDQELFWQKIKDLPKQIPGILEFSSGPNISSEGLNQGYTHSFIMTFESEKARDEYLPHPIHQAAVKVVILSADATQREIQRLLAAGAHSYLTKPVDVRALTATIHTLLADALPPREPHH